MEVKALILKKILEIIEALRSKPRYDVDVFLVFQENGV